MIDLAVATQEETFERMRDPLAERDVAARPIQPSERVLDLDDGEAFAGFDVGFVYPSRLMEGAVAAERLSVPWVNDRADVLASRNKAGAIARFATAGVPTPRTVMISNPVSQSELTSVFQTFDGPVVIKPNSTTRGQGVAKAADLDTFLGICDYLDLVHDYRATGDKAFLVQEFVPQARDYRVMTIEGEYVGAVERRLPAGAERTGQWKHNVHRGAEATAIDLDPDHRELAERAARSLDVDWLGVDLLVSGDRAYVTETNARPTIDDAGKYESDFYDRLASLIRTRVND